MREGANLPSYPSIGELVADKYRIVRLLGEGGMGAVFAAEHVLLRQLVALKIRRPSARDDDRGMARFLNEARAAARLESEHIARVMDVGVLPSRLAFIAMELLDGIDLANLVAQRGPLPPDEAVGYVLQALEGIADAHGHGIVHRDLKPANLFRVDSGRQRGIVKVLDFGISKLIDPLAAPLDEVTTGATILGTPSYMSPEQIRAPKAVDARADVWALGVILYELLTGVRPFEAESLGELLVAVLEKRPRRLEEHGVIVLPQLEATILRCLEVTPDYRFADAAALADALAVDRRDGKEAAARVRAALRAGQASPRALTPMPGGVAEGLAEAANPPSANDGRTEALPQDVKPPTRSVWEGSVPPRTKSPVTKIVGVVLAIAAAAGALSIVLAMSRARSAPPLPALVTAASIDASEIAPAPSAPSTNAAIPSATPLWKAEDLPPSGPPAPSSSTRITARPETPARSRPRAPHSADAGAASISRAPSNDPNALDLLNRH